MRCRCRARVGVSTRNETPLRHIADKPDVGAEGLKRVSEANVPSTILEADRHLKADQIAFSIEIQLHPVRSEAT